MSAYAALKRLIYGKFIDTARLQPFICWFCTAYDQRDIPDIDNLLRVVGGLDFVQRMRAHYVTVRFELPAVRHMDYLPTTLRKLCR